MKKTIRQTIVVTPVLGRAAPRSRVGAIVAGVTHANARFLKPLALNVRMSRLLPLITT